MTGEHHTMNDLFADAVAQLLADQCTPAIVREIEAQANAGGGASSRAQTLWQHLDNAGFADALVPEAQGGAGLSLSEVFPVLLLCGQHAVPVPLVQTMFARALLAQGGVDVPRGSITLASARTDADGGLLCDAVAGGRVADAVLVSHDGHAHLMKVSDATASASSFALDATLHWSAAAKAAAPRLATAPDVQLFTACINAAQLAGALLEVFNRTLQYANDRIQFGRPIGKFQAIQHQLSVISEHAFAARMAAQLGCSAPGIVPDRLRVAVAKARTSEAALEVAGLSHSVHGAIGFTQEFDLQLFTRRLHHWRQTGGSESHWHSVVGAALLDSPELAGSGLSLDLMRSVTDRAELATSP
jgi:acyl-CoA dehydrogenase